MIQKNFIVSGKDIKELPLKVVCFKEDLDFVKNYISNETSWDIMQSFDDNVYSSARIVDYLTVYRYYYQYELFVVKNISQIKDNIFLSKAIEDQELLTAPIYCIESEQIIYNLPEFIEDELNELCDMRENGLISSPWGRYVESLFSDNNS